MKVKSIVLGVLGGICMLGSYIIGNLQQKEDIKEAVNKELNFRLEMKEEEEH